MIIKDISIFEKWFPNSTYTDLEKLASYFVKAEFKHLRPVLGDSLFEYVEGLMAPESVMNNDDQKLLDLCQALVVHFGTLDALPMLNVTLNQFGSLSVTQNDHTIAASKDRSEKLEAHLRDTAWDDVEQLLLFLEKESVNFTDEEGNELWKESEWYAIRTEILIFTAKEFNDHVFIDNSRVKFKQLFPAIRKVQKLKLVPAFGSKAIKKLIENKINNNLTDQEIEVNDLLCSALALLTISQDEELSRPDSIHGYKPFEASQEAESEIQQAKRIMRDNPEIFPDFTGNQPDYQEVKPFENSSDNSVFFIGGVSR